jgi:hypothetical protein
MRRPRLSDALDPNHMERNAMGTQDVRVGDAALKQFSREIFVRVGFSPEDAEVQADVLVWANLRGVDSHGVLRIPWYVELVDKGHMHSRPKIQVQKETPATLILDADYAPGPVVTVQAMHRVMKKAREVGIGWALIRNTTHQGALGYYSLMAAREGMAGLAVVCNPPNMAPGARRPDFTTARSPSPSREIGAVLSSWIWQPVSPRAESCRWRWIRAFPFPDWALDKDGNRPPIRGWQPSSSRLAATRALVWP